MNIPKITLPLLAAVALSVVPAKAATIQFAINGVEGQEDGLTYTQTEGGLTMTLSNPIRLGFDATFPFDNDGTLLFRDNFYLKAFDFTFDADVKIISFTINLFYGDSPDNSFTLSAPGSIDSTGNLLITGEQMISGGGFSIASGITGTWTAIYGGYPAGSISSITVETVPEPSTYMLLTSAGLLGVGAYVRNRRQARLAAQ